MRTQNEQSNLHIQAYECLINPSLPPLVPLLGSFFIIIERNSDRRRSKPLLLCNTCAATSAHCTLFFLFFEPSLIKQSLIIAWRNTTFLFCFALIIVFSGTCPNRCLFGFIFRLNLLDTLISLTSSQQQDKHVSLRHYDSARLGACDHHATHSVCG